MSREWGLVLFRPYFLCVLADACLEVGPLNDGQGALTEALATVDQHEERQAEAEIYRLKGKLLLRRDESNAGEARKCFERAIEIAQATREVMGRRIVTITSFSPTPT